MGAGETPQHDAAERTTTARYVNQLVVQTSLDTRRLDIHSTITLYTLTHTTTPQVWHHGHRCCVPHTQPPAV